MKAKVYIETTVVSYIAASPSRDLVVAAHQQITREWWERRDRFELFVSQAVVEEAARGDVAAAARRAALLSEIPVLELGAEVHEFANRLLRTRIVPAKASIDAIHIAVAVVNRVDYLGHLRVLRALRVQTVSAASEPSAPSRTDQRRISNETRAICRSHSRASCPPLSVTSRNCHESWSNEYGSVSRVIGTRTRSLSGV